MAHELSRFCVGGFLSAFSFCRGGSEAQRPVEIRPHIGVAAGASNLRAAMRSMSDGVHALV